MKHLAHWFGASVAILALHATATEEVAPPHVYQAARELAADVETLREYTGRPVVTAAPWVVDYAEPRHVYYQAQTMARKANRLAQQFGVEAAPLPEVPEGAIVPANVLELVHTADGRIDAVMEELGLGSDDDGDGAAFDPDRLPRDVLREVVQVNRQFNFMLDSPIRPADVYTRLELAAAYVAGALTEDASQPIYGTLPAFEAGKQPADVYRRVLDCLGIAQRIGAGHGIEVLRLNLRRESRRRDIAPADVYDLATTVLAELAHLTLELDAQDVDLPPVERPKHIFPAHVFQMAGMLEDELLRLEEP